MGGGAVGRVRLGWGDGGGVGGGAWGRRAFGGGLEERQEGEGCEVDG